MLYSVFFARHLDDDEELVLVVHKYVLVGVVKLFWPTLSFLLSAAALYLVYTSQYIFLGVAIWGVISVVWWLRTFFDYYLDAWIITDQGIIDIEWHGWFHRESTRVLYSDIQGVSYEIRGVLGTLLRFGTISIEKISSGEDILLEFVSKPRSIEKLILKRMETYLHSKNLKDASHVQEILSTLVAQHMALEEFDDEEEEDDDDDQDE